MTDHRANIQDLFLRARDVPEEQRDDFLQKECNGDEKLLAEVNALLKVETTATQCALHEPPDMHKKDPLLGVKVDHYTIKRVIGSGGMGVVYEAQQKSPRRVIALKMMKHGITSKHASRRFEYEVQTLGRLRHEGIAQIYEAGTYDDSSGDRPWFAMEYFPNAKPLNRYCDDKKLGTRQRLELFKKVCVAVQHGHTKGIIHRDLKPGNILVTSGGIPKIIDFGVARSTDSDLAVTTLQTDVGSLIGTLQYMSPEQCEANPHDIDTRSDVYALGVILYELLCGKLPYDVENVAIHEVVRVIMEEEPTKLSSINRRLRGDIETITLKALEKDRDRRYQNTLELEQDISRYLEGEPIAARRPSAWYYMNRFAKRHRVTATSIVAVFAVLVVAIIWISILLDREAKVTSDLVTSLESEKTQRKNVENEKARVTDVMDLVFEVLTWEHTREDQVPVTSVLLERSFDDDPRLGVDLNNVVGRYLETHGHLDLASEHLRKVVYYENILFGESSPTATKVKLAEILAKMCNNTEDDSLCEEANAILTGIMTIQGTLEDANRTNFHAEYVRGVVLYAREKYLEAEETLQKVYALQREEFGDNDLDTLKSIGLLSRCWHKLAHSIEDEQEKKNKHSDSLNSLHKIEETLLKHHENRDYEIVQLYTALGGIYSCVGNNTETLSYFEKAINRATAHFGKNAERTKEITASRDFSYVLQQIEASNTNAKNFDTESFVTNLGKLLENPQRPDKDNPIWIKLTTQYASCLTTLQKYNEAQENYEAALRLMKLQDIEDEVGTTWITFELAMLYFVQKEFSESERCIRIALESPAKMEAINMMQEFGGTSSLLDYQMILIKSLTELEKWEELIISLTDYLELLNESPGDVWRERVFIQRRMVHVLIQLNDVDGAIEILEPLVELVKQSDNTYSSMEKGDLIHILGKLYLDTAQYNQAENCFTYIYVNNYPIGNMIRSKQHILSDLVRLYNQWGDEKSSELKKYKQLFIEEVSRYVFDSHE